MPTKQICVLLKCGQWLPVQYSDMSMLKAETETLAQRMLENETAGARYCRCDEGVRWCFRLDELAGFYVTEVKTSSEEDRARQERHIKATEKLVKIMEKAVGHGESWKGDDEA